MARFRFLLLLLICTAFASGIAHAVFTPTLCWSMDESTGNYTESCDGSGDYDLLNTTSDYTASGKFNGGRDFERDNKDQDTVKHSTSVALSGNALSMGCWVNTETIPSGGSNSEIMCQALPPEGMICVGQNRAAENGDFVARFNGIASVFAGMTPSTSQWYHVVVVWDGTNGTIYVDGTKKNSDPKSFAAEQSLDNIRFGDRNTGAQLYDGRIDECFLYDGAMSDAQVLEVYQRTTSWNPTLSITNSTWNVTAATNNGTSWRASQTNQVTVTDATPTTTFQTNIAANFSVGLKNLNYTDMIADDPNTECSVSDTTSHTCTLSQKLNFSSSCLYFAGISADGASTYQSGCMNIARQVLNPPFFSLIQPANATTIPTSSTMLNWTIIGTYPLFNSTLYLSTVLSEVTSKTANVTSFINQSNQTTFNYSISDYFNSTRVFYSLEVADNETQNKTNGTYYFDIASVDLCEAQGYFQVDPTFQINDTGTYNVSMQFRMGWKSRSSILEQQYNHSKTLLTGATLRTVYFNANNSPAPNWTANGADVNFTSFRIINQTAVNQYRYNFTVPAIEVLLFNASCTGTNESGSCSLTVSLNNTYSFDMQNVDIFAPVASLPNWTHRDNITITYVNQSAIFTTKYKNNLADDCSLIIGGQSGDDSSYNGSINNTGNSTINPTFRVNNDGILMDNMNLAGHYLLTLNYDYSSSISYESGEVVVVEVGGGGGGGGTTIQTTVIQGGDDLLLRFDRSRIDDWVLYTPFKSVVQVKNKTLEANRDLRSCIVTEGEGLECIIEENRLTVKITLDDDRELSFIKPGKIQVTDDLGTVRSLDVRLRVLNLAFYLKAPGAIVTGFYTVGGNYFAKINSFNQPIGVRVLPFLVSLIVLISAGAFLLDLKRLISKTRAWIKR